MLLREWWVHAHDEKELEVNLLVEHINCKFETRVEKYVQISQHLKWNGVFNKTERHAYQTNYLCNNSSFVVFDYIWITIGIL